MSNASLREILVEAPSGTGPGDDLQRASTRLLSDYALGFWTEHSERITIISWAARAGIDSETRKRWGRWLPNSRATRVMIEEAQARVASAARRSIYNSALFDEGLVLTELEAHLRGRGANVAETARQTWLLQGCRPVTDSAAPAEKSLAPSSPAIFSDDEDNSGGGLGRFCFLCHWQMQQAHVAQGRLVRCCRRRNADPFAC